MKKNRTMRLAALLLVLTLITSCFVGGTFAKYTTSTNSNDHARVAYWGFNAEQQTLELKDLFSASYTTDVTSKDKADVIAPGTEGNATFVFVYDEVTSYEEYVDGVHTDNEKALAVTGPEVDYNFTVAVEDICDADIKANPNIQWKLDNKAWGSWDQMVKDIKALSGHESGTQRYEANTLPKGFGTDEDAAENKHTISWQWIFETADKADTTTVNEMNEQDATDTAMGNAELLDDCSIKITITATQVND